MSALESSSRWWIAPPGEDESLRSVLDRAADLYDCNPLDLWIDLHQDPDATLDRVDDPGARSLARMAKAMACPGRKLGEHSLPPGPSLLLPSARHQYCPVCLQEDLAAGRPFNRRRAWARVLRTRCAIHQYPLLADPDDSHDPLGLGPNCDTRLTVADQEILDLIDRFAIALELSLFEQAKWPIGWRGNAFSARDRLLRAACNTRVRTYSPRSSTSNSGALYAYVHGPRHLMDPAEPLTWDMFRAMEDPAHRRAALWVAAWQLVPNLDASLSPGWFHQ